jgi:hypothetical protein
LAQERRHLAEYRVPRWRAAADEDDGVDGPYSPASMCYNVVVAERHNEGSRGAGAKKCSADRAQICPSAKCSSIVVYIRDAEKVMVRSATAVLFIFVFGSTAPMPGSLFGSVVTLLTRDGVC